MRFFVLVACVMAFAARPATAQVSAAYLIRTQDGKPIVEPIPPEKFPPPQTARGLLVWTDATGDRWLPLSNDYKPDRLYIASKPTTDQGSAEGFSRGGKGGGGVESALAGLTRTHLVDPRNITDQIRGGELVTPLPGATPSLILRPNPIVRRLAEDDGEKFPALEGKLTGPETAQTIAFPAGSDRVTLRDLSPGSYHLSLPARGKNLPVELDFIVASPAQRAVVLGRSDALTRELGTDDPLVLLYTVESLLGAGTPRKGLPASTGDILDLLEETPDAKLSPYLRSVRDRLSKGLAALSKGAEIPQAAPSVDLDATGVPVIDEVRAHLIAGRFKEAKKLLDQLVETPASDSRTSRLATLYRAVALAETGVGADAEAEGLFLQAAQATPESERPDRFRVHVNFALFYHRRAQDRLNNHAFQMAAGVIRTVSAVVSDWAAAREQFDLAAKHADPRQAAGLGPDLARLYALMADIVRTLDPSDLSQGLMAAASAAADRAADAVGGGDPVSRGIAREIQGNLALDRGDLDGCQKAAEKALADFVAAGFLPGVENAHQLLGRVALRAKDAKAAVRHLTASHLVAELLRDRFAADQIGRTRAGFFARRAFVLDALVELHLGDGRWATAVELAEQAKARGYTDLLAAEGLAGAGRNRGVVPRTLPEILKSWPKNTAAVEYFLGRTKVWAFVVTTTGEVRAFPLTTPDGKDVDPFVLLDQARKLVGGMEGYARKMAERILNDEGFDNSWQDDLHWLASVLLPPDLLAELRRAEVVLLAPQHILHYLPFAALVLERDPNASKKQLARPKRFLIDEPFVTVNVPSIIGWDLLRRDPTRQGKGQKATRAAYAVGLVQAPGEARLDGVETDLANLKETYRDDLRQVLDAERATAGSAADLFRRSGLLLLATHGYNNADSPLESYLVLHPEPTNPNGHLSGRDIYNKRVESDVVIMSACYTGLGDRSPLPGDDLFGLQRAFLQAGARAVIAGLWDVYDLTAPELLRGCLERLAQGVPAARAMKEAQKAFLDKYRQEAGDQPFIHPYFWAVYSVLGNDQAATGRP